jgi:hypothetical protein
MNQYRRVFVHEPGGVGHRKSAVRGEPDTIELIDDDRPVPLYASCPEQAVGRSVLMRVCFAEPAFQQSHSIDSQETVLSGDPEPSGSVFRHAEDLLPEGFWEVRRDVDLTGREIGQTIRAADPEYAFRI